MDAYSWITLIAAVVAAIAAVWAVVFGYRERARHQTEKLPRITATIRANHVNGWHHCFIQIKNRVDSDIHITSVHVASPKGFLLAKADQTLQELDRATIAPVLHPDWGSPATPSPQIDRNMFVKAENARHGNSSLKIRFAISVKDAERSNVAVLAETNAIDWDA